MPPQDGRLWPIADTDTMPCIVQDWLTHKLEVDVELSGASAFTDEQMKLTFEESELQLPRQVLADIMNMIKESKPRPWDRNPKESQHAPSLKTKKKTWLGQPNAPTRILEGVDEACVPNKVRHWILSEDARREGLHTEGNQWRNDCLKLLAENVDLREQVGSFNNQTMGMRSVIRDSDQEVKRLKAELALSRAAQHKLARHAERLTGRCSNLRDTLEIYETKQTFEQKRTQELKDEVQLLIKQLRDGAKESHKESHGESTKESRVEIDMNAKLDQLILAMQTTQDSSDAELEYMDKYRKEKTTQVVSFDNHELEKAIREQKKREACTLASFIADSKSTMAAFYRWEKPDNLPRNPPTLNHIGAKVFTLAEAKAWLDTGFEVRKQSFTQSYMRKIEWQLEGEVVIIIHSIMVMKASTDPDPFTTPNFLKWRPAILANKVANYVFKNKLHLNEESEWHNCHTMNPRNPHFAFKLHPLNINEAPGQYFSQLSYHASIVQSGRPWHMDESMNPNGKWVSVEMNRLLDTRRY